ncbi:hypothetical protein [Flavobacterium sp.]|uniref:DUF6929 family protein n=1 Tax=Flavobacterium sp. TaxID=239 RepID=UPI0026222D58|nr:hypothetical protein [Flavobacterium sp.]
MEKFLLSVFLEITGIGSASGIVYKDNSLFIISDNAGFLYEYNIESAVSKQHALISDASENILKKNKPDLEAITLKGNELHVFGSGSTEKRNRQFIFNIKTQQTSEENLATLYQKIKQTTGISDDELNIEGALFYNDHLHLFQRGNGMNSKNKIIKVNSNNEVQFQTVTLPKIKHVEATFTDAIVVGNKIYFLAAAEDTVSTYEDGEILGSMIGCLDIETLNIDFAYPISNQHKFEGLTLYKDSENEIEFLLCEDNDTEELQSKIYKLTIKK